MMTLYALTIHYEYQPTTTYRFESKALIEHYKALVGSMGLLATVAEVSE